MSDDTLSNRRKSNNFNISKLKWKQLLTDEGCNKLFVFDVPISCKIKTFRQYMLTMTSIHKTLKTVFYAHFGSDSTFLTFLKDKL